MHRRAPCDSPLGSTQGVFSAPCFTALRLAAAFAFSLRRIPSLVTAFRSPATAAPFRSLHSRVNVPDLLLRSPLQVLYSPFGHPAPLPPPVSRLRLLLRERPVAASSLQIRFARPASTPPWGFYSPPDQRVRQSRSTLDRLLPWPDLPSLPAALLLLLDRLPISRKADYGSTFQDRYLWRGWLIHKPLGTSFTMRPATVRRQSISVPLRTFSTGFIELIFQMVSGYGS